MSPSFFLACWRGGLRRRLTVLLSLFGRAMKRISPDSNGLVGLVSVVLERSYLITMGMDCRKRQVEERDHLRE